MCSEENKANCASIEYNEDDYTSERSSGDYEYDEDSEVFTSKRVKLEKFKWQNEFQKLSVRYTDHPTFYLKSDFIRIIKGK